MQQQLFCGVSFLSPGLCHCLSPVPTHMWIPALDAASDPCCPWGFELPLACLGSSPSLNPRAPHPQKQYSHVLQTTLRQPQTAHLTVVQATLHCPGTPKPPERVCLLSDAGTVTTLPGGPFLRTYARDEVTHDCTFTWTSLTLLNLSMPK